MRRTVWLNLLAGFMFFIPITSQAQMDVFGRAGSQLTKEDYNEMAAAAQPLLTDDSLPIGATQNWNNPKTGNQGSIKLLERFQTKFEGNTLPCRKLKYRVLAKGTSDPYNIVLSRCKVADGSWKFL